jgi:hypothetical protein
MILFSGIIALQIAKLLLRVHSGSPSDVQALEFIVFIERERRARATTGERFGSLRRESFAGEQSASTYGGFPCLDRPNQTPVTKSANSARQGVTGHNVLWVLAISTLAAIICLGGLWVMFFGH